MIIGIGLDVVEISRLKEMYERRPNIIDRILTDREKEKFLSLSEKRKIEFLGGRFAAKEAFSKAIGTGIGQNVGFLDIEIVNDEKGKPNILQNVTSDKVHVSITHTQQFVAAQVIIEDVSSC